MDALDWLNEDEARHAQCVYHGFDACNIDQYKDQVDVLLVTSSCRPFSIGRIGRMTEGAKIHEDYKLLEVTLKVAKRLKPKAILMEQVFGFTKAESSQDSESPLQKFLKLFHEVLGREYEVMILFCDGQVFLVLCRHRVFIVAIREDVGGADALAQLKLIIKEHSWCC